MKNSGKIIGILLLCLLVAVGSMGLYGCGTDPITNGDSNGTTVICTNFAAYALTAPLTEGYTEDGGDRVVNVQVLGKPGQDMHSYEPSAQDIISLSNADVVVCTGAEGWLDAAIKASGNTAVRVVSMMEVCDTMDEESAHDHDSDHDHDHGDGSCSLIGQDEHVWLSVNNAIRITHAISDALKQVDEKNASVWQAHEEPVCRELENLEDEYEAMMDSVVRNTVVIADRHPFSYLFRDLGLDCVAAFPGCSSETSASFETQMKLIETVKSMDLPYIFIMEGSDGKVAEVVSTETGAQVLTLNSLQVVTDYENTTYLAVMKQNLENLKKALQ